MAGPNTYEMERAYIEREIDPGVCVIRPENTPFHLWKQAQVPGKPHILTGTAWFGDKRLMGFFYVLGAVIGDGSFEIPTAYQKDELALPGLARMVEANREVLGNARSGAEVFPLLGLVDQENYGECRTTSLSGSLPGIAQAVSLFRFKGFPMKEEQWRVRKNSLVTPEGRNGWTMLSAADVMRTIQENIPNVTLFTQPHQVLTSEDFPL